MGYDPQTVAVNGQTTINVTMKENSVILNEVVAIGYGTVKKSDATGSVAVIKPDEVEAGLATSVQDMLVGQTPGVVVTQSGGPEGAANIRIRGGSSLSASNDPLIVLDGVPLSANSVQGMSNPLAMISPDNIESMTVLKDASATAIYGARASNGVIIVTTKKGQSGKPQVSFSANMYVNTARKTWKAMDANTFISTLKAQGTYTDADHGIFLGDTNTDWQDEVLRTTVSSDYNLAVGGTAGWLPYRVSASYTNSNGIIKTSKMDRVTVGFNLTPKFFDNHLSVNANVKGYYIRNRFGDSGAVYNAISYNPTQPVYTNIPVQGNAGQQYLFNGFYQVTQTKSKYNMSGIGFMSNADINPVSNLLENNNFANVYRSNGNLQLDYSFHFLPELHANLNLGYDVSKTNETHEIAANSGISWKNGYQQFGGGYNDQAGLYQFNSNTLLEFYLNYKKEFEAIESDLDVTAGYTWNRVYTESHNSGAVPYTDEYYFAQPNPNAANGEAPYILNVVPTDISNHPIGVPFVPSPLSEDGVYYSKNHLQLLSFFGRLNYQFKNRYLLTFTLRADATSRFNKDNRWGYFPAAALAWRINNESWMQDAAGWLSDLKLRLGWGQTGQQDVGSWNNYTVTYQQSQGTVLYPNGLNAWYNPYFANGYNDKLKWETTTSYNVGIDFGFLNNRIMGSIEGYFRKTTDLLSYVTVPAGSSTVNMLHKNIGDLENYGVEFNLTARPIVTNDFTWILTYNVGYNHNKITKLNDNNAVYETGDGIGSQGQKAMANKVGYAANTFWLYQQVYDENGTPLEGVYVDQNGDGQIDNLDRVLNHQKDPKVTMTFGSQFRYKAWDLGFSLRASIGNYLYNNVESSNGFYDRMFQYGLHNLVEADHYFNSQQEISDYYLRNASFLRCDNITLGYTWDNLLKNNLRLRLFAGVQNPFVITKYNGVDPEVFSGVDSSPYPRSTTYSLGLVATF